jgi:hypothetical protein
VLWSVSALVIHMYRVYSSSCSSGGSNAWVAQGVLRTRIVLLQRSYELHSDAREHCYDSAR